MIECLVEDCKSPKKSSGLCARHLSRRARYRGLSVEKFVKLLRKNECAICGRTDVTLDIDHDHETGEVRDMLCQGCNRALGLIEKREWVTKAQAYLARYDTPEILAI